MIVTGPAVGHWVANRIGGFFDPVCMVAIGWESDGTLTAGVAYRDWNGVSIEAQIAADKPLVPGFVRAIFDYPFRRLAARKIVVTTSSTHTKSINLLRRFGFSEEARLRDAVPGGDMLICTLDAAACRFLGDRHNGKVRLTAPDA